MHSLSLARVVVVLLTTLTVTLLAASAARAETTTTRYYTINHAQRLPSSPIHFLGGNPRDHRANAPVFLERYRSGGIAQQWKPVYPAWPLSPSITGEGADLLCNPFSSAGFVGCGFQGRGEPSPLKFVNRSSGKCMTAVPVNANGTYTRGARVVQSRCANDAVTRERQTWTPQPSSRDPYTRLYNRSVPSGLQCLDVTNFQGAPGRVIPTQNCQATAVWNQQLRFLEADRVTCTHHYPGTVCGLQGAQSSSSSRR